MIEKLTIVAVTAVISVLITFFSTVFLENRRNSIKQAREINPEYFKTLHRKAVLLREAIDGFGGVWERSNDEYNALIHDLYRILVAKIEDFNRELSVSTNADVFLLPARLQVLCEDIRKIINDAAYKTDIITRTKIIFESIEGERRTLEEFPSSISELRNLRFIETKRKPSLSGSPFCDRYFRAGLASQLRDLEARIKRLAVN